MARSSVQTASILSELYNETFANDSYEPFRISWSDLRGIAGVTKLYPGYLHKVNQSLSESGNSLIQFDNFLLVTQENNVSHIRLVPPRIVEQYLYEDLDDLELDDDDEDTELDNPEDCEIDDDDVESV